jgi:MFS family permease
MSDPRVKEAAPRGGVPAGLHPPSGRVPGQSPGADGGITTDVPARLDRLPWGSFHWLLITALGITWVLDGLEATIVAAIGSTLEKPTTLGLRAGQIGLAGTLYLAGAIGGALFFGHVTDRLGRKKLFTVTLGIYLAGAALTACSWNFWSFVLFRVLTGMAIGGEYSAINSAIDELIPARVRRRVDLAINGTYWLGAAAGAAVSVPPLNPHLVPEWLGWRIAFGLGALVDGR